MVPKADTPRYGCFEIRTSCSECGNPLVLNGPALSPKCDSCLQEVEIPATLWASWMQGLEDDYHQLEERQGSSSTIISGGFTAKVESYRLQPRCPRCKEKMAMDLSLETNGWVACEHCEGRLDVFPAPAWLTEEMPSARQIIGADREGQRKSPFQDEEPRPIVMSCPQCGGTLKTTRETERITACAFCDVDVYLPDALWRKLHPARTIQEWFVRFEGKTRSQLDEEKKEEERRQKEEERKERQRARAEKDKARQLAQAKVQQEKAELKAAEGWRTLWLTMLMGAGIIAALVAIFFILRSQGT
jgi:hypothetical protein